MNLFEKQASEFTSRHIGISETDKQEMLCAMNLNSIEELVDETVPQSIRMQHVLNLPAALSEQEYLKLIKDISLKNKVYKSYIGQGYYDTITPSVILRNVFENPGWYTQYTPYQAEISQGRLESLLNFQTVVSDLTGLPVANASLLDEATAAAEAMTMVYNYANKGDQTLKTKFFVDKEVFPQTFEVLKTRSSPFGIELVTDNFEQAQIDKSFFGALIQYPNNAGAIKDYRSFIDNVHAEEGFVVMATDLLALTLLTSPGELNVDVAIGSSQRFGVPLGFGGPHAAFFSAKEEFKRNIPGRIIGVSIDANGNRALRMALQTREQHIKREKATSNICTAQALLANMAAMYAVYHGPKGLKNTATRIALLTQTFAEAIKERGFELISNEFFDTLVVKVNDVYVIKQKAERQHINLRYFENDQIGISLDETTVIEDLYDLINCFENDTDPVAFGIEDEEVLKHIPANLLRTSSFLMQPVFNLHHSETQMMRYIKMLENKDLSLNTSMISLGSCTMKLNAASEMIPLSWSHWSKIHPFVPANQAQGYLQIIEELSKYLVEITALNACSLQPNSGAQGEYAGLLTIKAYHKSRGDEQRNIMLIPVSAHGTNPASAVMAGMKVVVVKAFENGYIDVEDLKAKAIKHSPELAGVMITYPSTYGIFEETIKEITQLIHDQGGQVYMDGANMNAQVGLTAPGLIGADVCHLNLHKTFSIPHGGGGPGMGPICVAEHLAPFLPGNGSKTEGNYAVSAAPFGSASILLISYGYIRMLGVEGVKAATEYAILNANYMRAKLQEEFDILYLGSSGTCAHEFIVDLRPFKKSADIEAEDIAKRLIDYGFHAPTMSFPVPGTIMIEPTESEDKAELDRFCSAMLSIREEIREIENNKVGRKDNILKYAPHTLQVVTANAWERPYSREQAAFPLYYTTLNKFWPSVSRINNSFGDRNLICTCEPLSSYAQEI